MSGTYGKDVKFVSKAVKETIETIEEQLNEFKKLSDELKKYADKLDYKDDLSYVFEQSLYYYIGQIQFGDLNNSLRIIKLLLKDLKSYFEDNEAGGEE